MTFYNLKTLCAISYFRDYKMFLNYKFTIYILIFYIFIRTFASHRLAIS
jgi:hypothetical protein